MVKIKEAKVKGKRSLKKGELPSIQSKIPLKRMDGNDVVRSDGHYITYLRIQSQDINGLSASEQIQAMSQFDSLLRIYDSPLSILIMSFPPNIQENLRNWANKEAEARKKGEYKRAAICREAWNRLAWAERELLNTEYFLQLYAATKKEIVLAKTLVKNSSGHLLKPKDVTPEQTEKILTKLLNLNSPM